MQDLQPLTPQDSAVTHARHQAALASLAEDMGAVKATLADVVTVELPAIKTEIALSGQKVNGIAEGMERVENTMDGFAEDRAVFKAEIGLIKKLAGAFAVLMIASVLTIAGALVVEMVKPLL